VPNVKKLKPREVVGEGSMGANGMNACESQEGEVEKVVEWENR